MYAHDHWAYPPIRLTRSDWLSASRTVYCAPVSPAILTAPVGSLEHGTLLRLAALKAEYPEFFEQVTRPRDQTDSSGEFKTAA